MKPKDRGGGARMAAQLALSIGVVMDELIPVFWFCALYSGVVMTSLMLVFQSPPKLF